MADLQTDVRYIKGIGEQRARALGRLGIRTLGDLIAYFPRGYEDRRETRTIAQLQDGETACVEAMAAALLTGDGFAVLDEASPLADYDGIRACPTDEVSTICLVAGERPAPPVERFLRYLSGQGN